MKDQRIKVMQIKIIVIIIIQEIVNQVDHHHLLFQTQIIQQQQQLIKISIMKNLNQKLKMKRLSQLKLKQQLIILPSQ